MAVRAIPGSTRRRIARRLPDRIQIVFGRAAVFYSTIGMCSARDWDDKDYLRIIPRVVW